MNSKTNLLLACLLVALAIQGARRVMADESRSATDARPSLPAVSEAIGKAIPLLEAGSRGSAEQRQCFTCHSQAVPVLALAEIKRRGIAIDEENFQRQLKHTFDHLERGKQSYLDGAGQGGKALTAGYALWTLEAGGHAPDEITAAVAQFLLKYQPDDGHWSHRGNRPPSSGSDFTTTYVALRALAAFGVEEQRPAIDERLTRGRQRLATRAAHDTEDQGCRLWAWTYFEPESAATLAARAALVALQNEDGGWSQLKATPSDAYATATTLVALLETGQLAPDDKSIERGVHYLLSAQLADGSWHVATRAKGFQTYFESGFPHGKDQFISIAATGWATMALALTLPESDPESTPALTPAVR